MNSQAETIRERWRRNPEFIAAQREMKPVLSVAADMLRLRLKLGLSQEQLAERAGTKQANISRIEAGLSNPTLKVLQRIADSLDAELVVAFQPKPDQTPLLLSVSNEEGALVVDWPVRSDRRSVDLRSTASQHAQRIEA